MRSTRNSALHAAQAWSKAMGEMIQNQMLAISDMDCLVDTQGALQALGITLKASELEAFAKATHIGFSGTHKELLVFFLNDKKMAFKDAMAEVTGINSDVV